MTATVRSVRVVMEADVGGYIAKMRLAGRVTEDAFSGASRSASSASREIKSVDTSAASTTRTLSGTRTAVRGLEADNTRLGSSLRRTDSAIDKYSGRLRVLTDLALVGGPALLRLGAGSLPALSAGLAGLGAAGGGIGVTVAALSGLGDALDALDDYQAEPTVANLRKLQVEQAKLGTSGVQFLNYLDDLEPQLQGLQAITRDGIFPGWEAGIDDALTRLPIVRQIVNRLSREVGTLGADAGEALASDRLTPFFEYIRSSGAPILDDFARSTGNVALGLANILVAFDPLTRNFTAGLESMTDRFANWSEGLEDDGGFQAFLDEVRQAGPEVLDFLGATVGLMTGLARASAPVGHIVLPALTATANAIAAIANSPLGSTLYTAAAAWLLYGRAAKLAASATTGVQTAWAGMSRGQLAVRGAAGIGLLAAALTDYDDKAGIATTTTLGLTAALAGGGPWGVAAAATVGALIDITKANDDLVASTTSANEALNSGDTSKMRSELRSLREEIQETDDAATLTGLTDLWKVGTAAGVLFGGGLDKLGSAYSRFRGEEDDAKDSAAALEDRIGSTTSRINELPPVLRGTAQALVDAAEGAVQLSNALSVLNGWFDKRDAIRGYKDAIDGLTEGLKDGFTRDDVANIDSVGRSILQVADLIQNPKKRAGFLAGARDDLLDVADNSAPRAAAAIQRVVDKFDAKGLTSPPPIKLTVEQKRAEAAIASTRRDLHELGQQRTEPAIDADDRSARGKIDGVKGLMRQLSSAKATPGIDVQSGGALDIIGNVRRALDALNGKTATTYVRTQRTSAQAQAASGGGADGATVHGQREPYGDKLLYAVAPGEEIISNRNGQADRNRPLLKAINAGRFGADGRTVGERIAETYTKQAAGADDDKKGKRDGDKIRHGILFVADDLVDAFDDITKAGAGVAKNLDRVEKALGKASDAYDKQQGKLDDLLNQRSSTASSIASSYQKDPFGNGLAGFDAQVGADTGDLDAMEAALAKLVANGLDPKSALYQRLAASGDVNSAQQFAQLSSGELALRSQRLDALGTRAQGLGDTVAGQALNDSIAAQRENTKEARQLRDEIRGLRNDLKHEVPKKMHDAVRDGSHDGAASGSEQGTKAGNGDGDGRVATGVRTRPRPRTRRGSR